jgi:signal transduction histidine kinase
MSELGKLESNEVMLSRQQIDLAALVVEVAADMHEGDDRGVQLEARGTTRPVIVTGDRSRLTAIVRALVHAVLRERGEPGVVVAQCFIITDTIPAWAVLAVGPEPTVAALAEIARGTPPAFDEWRGGLGLALPVARRVVEALGGALWSSIGDQPRAGAALRLPLNLEVS